MEEDQEQMQTDESKLEDARRDTQRNAQVGINNTARDAKKKKLIAIAIIVMQILGVLYTCVETEKVIQVGQARETPKAIYDILEVDDLFELIEIKEDEKNGYYYDFVDGTDEKLDKVVERLKKEKTRAITKELLIKMIKAEVINQCTFLQGSKKGGFGGGSGVLTSGNTIAEKVWNCLIQAGYSEIATAGVMGNIHQESGGFNPAIVENGGSGQGIGLCQWSGGRRTKLEAFAASKGKSWQDLEIQLEYLLTELKGGGPGIEDGFIGNNAYRNEWQNATSIEQATRAFERGFERAGIPMIENRITWANNYYNQFVGTYTKTEEGTETGGEEEDSEYLGQFSGTVRIRRVTPDKNIGEVKNTSGGPVTNVTNNLQDTEGYKLLEKDILPNTSNNGKWSVYAKNLTSNSTKVNINSQKMQSASLIKLFIMATAFEEIEQEKLNKNEVIDDIRIMINRSDNDATNRIIDKLGGFAKINNYLVTHGYRSTSINRKMLANTNNGDNYTSTTDVGNLLETMYRGRCVSEAASQEMIEILKTQTLTSKIPAGVPAGVQTANKTGELSNVENDAAIVYKDGAHYILVVMSNDVNNTQEARNTIKDISSKVYNIMGESENTDENVVKVTDSVTTKNSSIKSKIFDLRYVKPEEFDEYVENDNRTALNVYTLDEKTKKLIIANWSFSTNDGVKIEKSDPINYRAVLSKYTMPMEYLIDFLIHSDDEQMVSKLADLAINSEYIIAVQDNVTTVQTIVDNQEKNYTLVQVGDDDYWIEDYRDWHTVKKTTTVTETVSNKIELTYADSWFVRYSKESNYATANFNQSGNNLTGDQGEEIGTFEIGPYCPDCNNPPSSTHTESGATATPGRTIAVPKEYYDGTKGDGKLQKGKQVIINGQIYTVEDVQEAKGDRYIAIFCDKCSNHGDLEAEDVKVYEANNVQEGEISQNDENKNLKGINTKADVAGDVTDTTTVTEEYLGETRRRGADRTETIVTEKKRITTIRTIENEYDSGKDQIIDQDLKNKQFAEAFLSCEGITKRFNMGWMEEMLSQSEKTINMIDLTRYLYEKALAYERQIENDAQYNFDVYKNNDLMNIYSSSTILEEYMKALINNPLRLYMKNHTSIDEGKIEKYIVIAPNDEDEEESQYKMIKNEYDGRGFGFDIFHRLNETDWNSGNQEDKRIVEHYEDLGVDIKEYVDMDQTMDSETVDEVMNKELYKWRKIVEKVGEEVELKEYQINALTAIAYEYGWSDKDTQNFVSAYNSYYKADQKDEFKKNFKVGSDNVFFVRQTTANKTEEQKKRDIRAEAIWHLFDTGEYRTPDGEILYPEDFENGSGIGNASDFLKVAYECWKKVCDVNPGYGGSSVPWSSGQIDCSGYVSWVLYEYGLATNNDALVNEFRGWQHTTESLKTVDWEKMGFEVIPVAGGENVINKLQPGDILDRSVGTGGSGHTQIVVEVKDGQVYAYDCGNQSNWAGKNGAPCINTSFATSDYRPGMIIRKK